MSQPRVTQFPTTLEPDAPIVQDAFFRFDRGDRAYVDGQILGIQSVIAKGSNGNALYLQGVPISSAAPALGQVLEYNGTQWAPATPSGAALAGDVTGTEAATVLSKIQGITVDAATMGAAGDTNFIQKLAGSWKAITAAAAAIALVGASVGNTPTTGQVLTATGTSTATWQTPAAIGPGSFTPGTADQLLDTNHAGTTTEWFTAGGDLTYASHSFTVTQAQAGAIAFGGGTTPTIRSSASSTQLTVGTNQASAVLNLQADAAKTIVALASTGLTFTDTGGVTRGSWENTHGRGTFGGGGSDSLAIIGPLIGAETAEPALWFLPNGTSPTTTNASLYGVSSGGLFINNANVYFASGNNSYLSVLGSAGTPIIQASPGCTSLTVGTNNASASLILADDANKKNMGFSLSSSTTQRQDWYSGNGTSQMNMTVTDSGVVTYNLGANFWIIVNSFCEIDLGGAGPIIYGNTQSYQNYAGTFTYIQMSASNGVQLFSPTTSFGGGTGVLGITNATTAPTSNPSGGGILYATAGALKWLGSSGTLTTLGAADLDGFMATSGKGHCPSCGTDFAHEWHNEKYGRLTVCMKCLTDEIGERPWIVREAA